MPFVKQSYISSASQKLNEALSTLKLLDPSPHLPSPCLPPPCPYLPSPTLTPPQPTVLATKPLSALTLTASYPKPCCYLTPTLACTCSNTNVTFLKLCRFTLTAVQFLAQFEIGPSLVQVPQTKRYPACTVQYFIRCRPRLFFRYPILVHDLAKHQQNCQQHEIRSSEAIGHF